MARTTQHFGGSFFFFWRRNLGGGGGGWCQYRVHPRNSAATLWKKQWKSLAHATTLVPFRSSRRMVLTKTKFGTFGLAETRHLCIFAPLEEDGPNNATQQLSLPSDVSPLWEETSPTVKELSLSRSQFGGCSATYNTPAYTKVVCRRTG